MRQSPAQVHLSQQALASQPVAGGRTSTHMVKALGRLLQRPAVGRRCRPASRQRGARPTRKAAA
eukprot:4384950-Prymnesium_polylepis.1